MLIKRVGQKVFSMKGQRAGTWEKVGRGLVVGFEVGGAAALGGCNSMG